ncbi:MAG: hypothetical protein EOO43_25470, partial [Flavobacterium sp.]
MLFNKEEINLLDEAIPVFEKIKPSLVSVLKAHSETNLSNLLAYILKGEDYPQLQELCLPVLIEKIDLGPNDSDILNDIIDDGYKNVKIYTEYPTKFGRIDILIVKEDEISWRRRALIIENKLYHNLQNDLDDYFYSVSKREDIPPGKIAVVALSLKPFNSAFPSFMKSGKITH